MKTIKTNSLANRFAQKLSFLGTQLALALSVVSSIATAGGMVSSGGELIQDAKNPWWVKNTTEVKYCLKVDASSISGRAERIPALVESALQYWKKEFNRKLVLAKNSDYINSYFNKIGVGHQTFKKIDCDGSEDLKFQFGYGTLATDQIKELKDHLKSIVGITVRTAYDEVLLRGKGYIYINSDLGDFKYVGGRRIVEQPWKTEGALFLAIVHELGHVFGIPHAGSKFYLMSEQFMDYLLSQTTIARMRNYDPVVQALPPFYFAPVDQFPICPEGQFTDKARLALGIPNQYQCLILSTDQANKKIYLSAANREFTRHQVIGVFMDLDFKAETDLAVNIFMTELQKIFSWGDDSPWSIVVGPTLITLKGSATYYQLNGLALPTHLIMRPDRVDIISILNGKIESLTEGWLQVTSMSGERIK